MAKAGDRGAEFLREYQKTLSPEERRKRQSNGGKKRAENMRKKKLIREYLDLLLTEQVINEMNLALIAKALNGDIKAYEVIRDTMGESPKQQVELSTNDAINITITGDDDNQSESEQENL